MNVDPYIVLGSAVVGLLVGLTGAGGGALMTPMLILVFGVKPSTAISSDLVAAVLMRPVGAAVHLRKGTVNLRLVGWMVLGSVPMAFLGAYLLHLFGIASAAQSRIEIALGTLAFGRVEFGVTASIVIGSVPAVLVGSFLSSRAPDRYIRPAITFVIFASGLKYVGVGTTALGWVLCAVLLGAAAVWLARAQPWRNGRAALAAGPRRLQADAPAGGPPPARAP